MSSSTRSRPEAGSRPPEFRRAGLVARALLMALSFGALAACAVPGPKSPATPNLILIVADDLGYADVGCYGQSLIRTPHLDRLAREGLRFTQAYAGSGEGRASACSLLTGRHTGHAVIRANQRRGFAGEVAIPEETQTLAELLRAGGYQTAAMGRWSLGSSTGAPTRQGFDHAFGYLSPERARNHYPDYLWRDGSKVALPGNRGRLKRQYADDLITEEATAFIRLRDRGRPFFLYLALTAPRASLQVPRDSLAEYDGLFSESYFDGEGFAAHRAPRAAYAAMVTRMDRAVGQVMRTLEEQGIDGNTLVIFTSDNGPSAEGGADPTFFKSSGAFRGEKGSCYEGGLRVPLIARWPGSIDEGRVSQVVTAGWDLLPTLLDVAGVGALRESDGLSLLPTLVGGARQAEHGYLYWECQQSRQAVRMGRFKAIRNRQGGAIELYDVTADAGEEEDLASLNPGIVAQVELIFEACHHESVLFPLLGVAGSGAKGSEAR